MPFSNARMHIWLMSHEWGPRDGPFGWKVFVFWTISINSFMLFIWLGIFQWVGKVPCGSLEWFEKKLNSCFARAQIHFGINLHAYICVSIIRTIMACASALQTAVFSPFCFFGFTVFCSKSISMVAVLVFLQKKQLFTSALFFCLVRPLFFRHTVDLFVYVCISYLTNAVKPSCVDEMPKKVPNMRNFPPSVRWGLLVPRF